jgi:hypothetical protein
MKEILEKYRVIKGGTSNRWRVGDIWEVIQYDFEKDAGWTHLCRKRTSVLNGQSLARQMVRLGHFERIDEQPSDG